jgi:hypothetical protein
VKLLVELAELLESSHHRRQRMNFPTRHPLYGTGLWAHLMSFWPQFGLSGTSPTRRPLNRMGMEVRPLTKRENHHDRRWTC